MQFSTKINASKETVWNTLWQDETFRDWSGLIDPGTYMDGELVEGNTVQFISQGGYGVSSLIAELTPNEHLLFKHQADTQHEGTEEREKEWTGGEESYDLIEENGVTTLTVAIDLPSEQESYFAKIYPTVLERIKVLAEAS
jgi:uncharacterized protein YndB with AHSA1/START domain